MSDFIDDNSIWKEDLFAIIGVSQDASNEEIRREYIKLAKEHHPDKFVNDKTVYAEAVEKFSKITVAYNILKDEKKKQHYLDLRRLFSDPVNSENPEESKKTPKERQAEDYFLQAKVLFDQNNIKDASDLIENAINLEPSVAKYHTLLGKIYKAKDWSGMAVAAFRKAAEIDPSDRFARNEITQFSINQLKQKNEKESFWSKLFGKK